MVDARLTDYGLENRLIEEANPIMRYLYDHQYALFYAVKLVLPCLLLLLLVQHAGRSLLVRGLLAAAALIYTGILGLHTLWLSHFLWATA